MGCKKCGKCCKITQINLSVPLTKSERQVFMFKGGRVYDDRVIFTTPCLHLDNSGLCLIYENRPQYCKDYLCEEAKCST